MRFVLTAVFGALAFILFPTGIFSIPFAQLNLGKIFCFIGSAFFGIITISALFGSYD